MILEPNRAEFAISAGTEPIIESNPPSFVSQNISSDIFNQLNRDYLSAHQGVLAVGASPSQPQQHNNHNPTASAAANTTSGPAAAVAAAISTAAVLNTTQHHQQQQSANQLQQQQQRTAAGAVHRIASDLVELQKANRLQGSYLQSNPGIMSASVQNSSSTVNYVNPSFQQSSTNSSQQMVGNLHHHHHHLLHNSHYNSSHHNQATMGYDLSQPFVSFLSEIESAILRSQHPIELNEVEEITVNGERGIWANRNEVAAWRGQLPIVDYPINEDPNPQVVTKRTHQKLDYTQEIAIR